MLMPTVYILYAKWHRAVVSTRSAKSFVLLVPLLVLCVSPLTWNCVYSFCFVRPHYRYAYAYFSGEERALSSKQQGAALLLHKYATLLCTHAGEILPVASSLASNGPRHFVVSSQIIQRELTGVLLPEFLTAMVLLQTCMPSVMDSSRTVPLISGLLDLLDKFNRLAPGVQKEDEEDLAWPGGIGSPTPVRPKLCFCVD